VSPLVNDTVRELLAELDAGDTLDNVIVKAIERGRTQGYQTGFQVGFLQACDEAEWRVEAAKNNAL
jgi:flagellar biosynthesis/type III secretory pathway protein FliH